MLCQELACMVTLQCLALPASGSGTFPGASSSFGSLTLPAACHNPGNHTRGPHALTAVQRDAAWLQSTGKTTNRRVKYTGRTAETYSCNPPHTFSQAMASKSWTPWWPSPAQQGHVNRAVEDIILCWWSREITSDSNNSRCQTQRAPHYISPQLLSTLLLERVKQKSQQRNPPAEWPEQLQVWQRAEKATGLLAWEERKQRQAWLSHHQASCLLAQDARAKPSHICKPLTQTRRAAAGSSAQCGGFRPSDSSLWLAQDCHECSFPLLTPSHH